MAAKNPDILMIDSRLLIKVCSVHFIQLLVLLVFTNFGVLKVHVSLSVPRIICDITDTDTLSKITQQTCMDTVKIMQCNDSET